MSTEFHEVFFRTEGAADSRRLEKGQQAKERMGVRAPKEFLFAEYYDHREKHIPKYEAVDYVTYEERTSWGDQIVKEIDMAIKKEESESGCFRIIKEYFKNLFKRK